MNRSVIAAAALLAAAVGCSDHPPIGAITVAGASGVSTTDGAASGPATGGSGSSGATASGPTGASSGGSSGASSGASSGKTSGSTGATSGNDLAPGTPCSSDLSCASGHCGASGTGHCCLAACVTTQPACAATDCDDTGACLYPGSTGTCAFCDTAGASCCSSFASDDGTLSVDSVAGNDAIACCGIGDSRPCQTLGRAMRLIDSSRTLGVTIFAAIDGGEGDWAPPGEVYPVVLGWDVELVAPGIYFCDANAAPANSAIFEIAAFSASDDASFASIASLAGAETGIGMNQASTAQTGDPTAILVKADRTLYLTSVLVNGSAINHAIAIDIQGGGGLVLGSDQSSFFTGTVNIGNDLAVKETDGWEGIVCEVGLANGGCRVSDAPLAGQSSVVIQGQEQADILAQDFSTISLTSAPVIGIPPAFPGFGECVGKPDGTAEAVLLSGPSSMTFSGGMVQCISGDGFLLQTSPEGNGNPSLTLSGSTVQNTQLAISASAGTATVSGSAIEFNYYGVQQGTDGTNVATIGLSDCDGGCNTVACCSNLESVSASTVPGVCVLNSTDAGLDADNCAWDTPGPDLFQCDSMLTSCSCELTSSCTYAAGTDGMDAVNVSTGAISTLRNTLSSAVCYPGH